MLKRFKKCALPVFITIFTLLMVFGLMNCIGNSAPAGSVTSAGRRTITQTSTVNATDLHFIVYQADRASAYILDSDIKLNVSFTSMTKVPGSWPFNDGKIHSVAVDIYGLDVPPGAKVNIEAYLYLNEWNTVKFHDIHFTYKDQPPVEPINADIGWAVGTNPGTSQGGWLISKYTATDEKKNEVVDLVGHQFLTSNAFPSLKDIMISNGVPDDPGISPVTITNWSVAVVPTLPSWDEIDNWQRWDDSVAGPITIKPGETVQFPGIIIPPPTWRFITPTPTRRVTPTSDRQVSPTPTWRTVTPTWITISPTPTRRIITPTPTPIRPVRSIGRRTITQPSAEPATDLHFIVYQADRNSAYILDSDIGLNIPYGSMIKTPSSWPFNDGRVHSVAVDVYGINVPQGARVNIEAILYLNEYNTVKFADIHWTYGKQGPVEPITADIGWSVATNPGVSRGGWLISKYTAVDKSKNEIVDLVGHEFLPSNASPSLRDMSISNGIPSDPGTSPVTITNWSVAVVSTLPSLDEIDRWQKWDASIAGPLTINPGQTVQFPGPNSVIATGRRTITQTSTVNATDLHFVVYQADVNTAYILGWGIKLSVPFTSMTAVPSSWPFNDGKIHSVAIDIYGINVPPGATVNIEATLYLNQFNTVKFHDVHFTYGIQAPVKPIAADIGWSVATNPGASKGGWLISKYTATDQNGAQIVDLVGHEFLPGNVSPAFKDMSISNGAPDSVGTSMVKITNWSVAVVSTLPTWDEINKWQSWGASNPGPIYIYPGQTVQFVPAPTGRVTPPPTGRITPTPTPTTTVTNIPVIP